MEISWTNDKKLKIVADVDTFKRLQDDAMFNNDYPIRDRLDEFITSDFAPTQIDLEQSIHPGVNKDYDVKLNGYDLELIADASHALKTGKVNAVFYDLVEKIRKQVPYQF